MENMKAEILLGDCRSTMAALPERRFHCCVTSPPYFGLRDYGVEGQIGMEPTPDDFVAAMVDVFRGVWRVLRDDGVAWLNLGDSYAGSGKGGKPDNSPSVVGSTARMAANTREAGMDRCYGLKPKDLIGVPWRVALALQADGWYLRDAIIWHKPSPMPGSQRDRCTTAYETIFQLTKNARYFFDLDAIAEPTTCDRMRGPAVHPCNDTNGNGGLSRRPIEQTSAPRNVWKMASQGFSGAHFATFPIALPTRCIKASTSEKGCCPDCGAPWERITGRTKMRRERPNELTKRTGEDGTGNHCDNTVAGVLSKTLGWEPTCKCGCEGVEPCRVIDPFNGAGTSAIACRRLGVDYTGCELNPDYISMSYGRIRAEQNRGSDVPRVVPAAGQNSLFD